MKRIQLLMAGDEKRDTSSFNSRERDAHKLRGH
jgi:hypothetical protein